jgi:type I restriction enzyme S subunit
MRTAAFHLTLLTIANIADTHPSQPILIFTSLDEECGIVSIPKAIDGKIVLHKRERAVFEEQFKALLHKLTTSEFRVADLDLSALGDARPNEAAA